MAFLLSTGLLLPFGLTAILSYIDSAQVSAQVCTAHAPCGNPDHQCHPGCSAPFWSCRASPPLLLPSLPTPWALIISYLSSGSSHNHLLTSTQHHQLLFGHLLTAPSACSSSSFRASSFPSQFGLMFEA